MTRLIDPNDIHSAADTWSGFLYQGKVALYHVLRIINEEDHALNYHLQLDSLEDFAIVDDDINPISLHQVKAMKSPSYASYRVAFEKLEKRSNDFACDEAYFHLAVQNEMSVGDIHINHPHIEIYSYSWGNHYCSLDEVNARIEDQIAVFLKNNGLSHHCNSDNIYKLRNKLEAIVCDQIIVIHAANHTSNGLTIEEGAYHFIIPLITFDEILRSDPSAGLDENYYLFLTKELLNQYYTEFCTDAEEQETIDTGDKQKLDLYMQQINGLNGDEIISFLQSILPHRTVKLDSIIGFKDRNINNEEFKDAFLQSLFELTACPGSIGDNFLWQDKDNFGYTVTAIKDGQANAAQVCRRIFKNINEADVQVPYETDKLITLELEVDSLKESLKIHTPSGEEEPSSGAGLENNILKWSKISLVTLNNAKNKLE